jgi:peptidoglycan/LPS O-acetylase OafA/YrhL
MLRHEEAWVVGGYSAVGLSCTVLVAFASRGGAVTRWVLGNPVMGHLGRISYGVYLWHCLLALVVLELPWEATVHQRMVAWLVSVVVLSTASWVGIERPWIARRVTATA